MKLSNLNLYDQAKFWLSQGIATIPIMYQRKIPSIKWVEYQERLPTQKELKNWFYMRNLRNMAIVVGWKNLVVLDFDEKLAFDLWFELYGVTTLTVATNRGCHVYLFCNEPVVNGSIPGIGDIKGNRGYVLSPGSIHPSGKVYTIIRDEPILTVNKLSDVFPFEYEKSSLESKISTLSDFQPKPITNDSEISNPWESADFVGQDDLIERIKNRFKIIDLFPNAIKTGSHRYITQCPLHDDHNPSFWIDAKKNLAGCFAGCGGSRPMDIINLTARIKNITNQQAIIYLRGLL